MTAEAWTDLPPPTDLPMGDTSPDPEPEAICPVCDLPIVRDPSWKRMRKYHPDCRPVSHASTGAARAKGSSKAEKEADECERILKGFVMKTALAVSIVDRFDAFCIMVNAGPVCSSFRAVCLRYPDLRKEFLRVPEGGSVLSLIAAGMFMAAPMAAHHGLIPSKRVTDLLVNLPITLYRLHDRMKEGEEGLTALMHEHMEEMKRHRAEERRDGNGEYVSPSRSAV